MAKVKVRDWGDLMKLYSLRDEELLAGRAQELHVARIMLAAGW